jgi:hypothetical protein
MASELTPVPDDLDFGVTVRGLVISQQVFGRYTLRHVLGRGGMGVVWLARDERLERDVALKFLPEAVHFDAGALDDLKRETRRCLDLTHPHIIRIHDFVSDQQAAAISMEYVDGKTLAALRVEKENRVFEVDDITQWVAETCQALGYAHEEVKVVHRDLKPGNLMLTTRGQMKIADFGIARSVSDSMTAVTMRRATSGTLVYMSPQQMNGDMPRISDDVYAFGATVYELLTSKPPFYSGDIPFQVRQSIPRKMSERRKELEISGAPIPQEWEDTIAACLEKAPEARPADMYAVAERLGLALGARPGHTKRDGAPPPASKGKPAPALPKIPRKPLPLRLIGLGVGAAAGAALAGWLVWSFLLWPYVATPGELFVTTQNPGATVHIPGQTDRVTPADFTPLRIGHYHVTISQTGYDPMEETITITEGAKQTIGNVVLKRAYGKLNLSSLPTHAHYVLTGTDVTADTTREGGTPDLLGTLPAGKYQITLTEPGLPAVTDQLEVPGHDTLTKRIDLVQQSILADASPDPAKAFLGQMDAGQLDAAGKASVVTLLGNAFDKYLSYGLIVPAAGELAKLKSLGHSRPDQEKTLAEKTASAEKQATERINNLIEDKEFAPAGMELQDLNGVLPPDSVSRLNAQFQPKLTQYQQQVAAAIKLSQQGPPAAGYDQLKTFAAQYPNDVSLQLALGQLQTEMPPDHARLTSQLKSFRQFATQNREAAANPDFQAMIDKFSNELHELDSLAAALAAAKNGPQSVRDEIAELQEKKAAVARRRTGIDDAAALANTANFFGRVVTGHSVVNSSGFTSEDQQRELANLQARIDADQATLAQPQGNVDEAQRGYDEFVAHVPW